MKVIPDTIDFRAYERSTRFGATVKRAPHFADRLAATFAHQHDNDPTMFSTKLRDRIHFRAAETTAWVGYSGHKKSLFLGQLGLDTAVQGKKILIASFEMLPEQTLHRMARQASGGYKNAKASLARFNAWSDGKMWLFDHMGRLSPYEMTAVCNYFADECEGDAVIIDSMMMVCGSEEHLDEQKQFSTDIVRIAQETRMHIHVVAHARKPMDGEGKPPTKYDLRGSAAITDQMHNVISVWANREKYRKLEEGGEDPAIMMQADAVVSVEKQRNGSWEGRAKMWFDTESMRFMDNRTDPVEPYSFMQEQEQ